MDNFESDLSLEYERLHHQALEAWAVNPTAGAKLPADYEEGKSGLVVGSVISNPKELDAVYTRLESTETGDIDLLQKQNIHLSLLAVTALRFQFLGEIPEADSQLVTFISDLVGQHRPRLQGVRCVALRNRLLLTGFPDHDSRCLRSELTKFILKSRLCKLLIERHSGFLLPPRLWHVTVARFNHENAPPAFRCVYLHDLVSLKVQDIEFEPLGLFFGNYNWTRRTRLEPPDT